ncbi:hypothetical protein FPANT_7379 [Fusarium pseudoanthophilum]|uniref:NACHT domain-containing protein n=1 Tax=Fusarium pseudoanthophilum TaxID=48495 RepID=A0A8H5L3S7_9HYPO|nr:hypothetical protein FPANT_7379 [Fusarium pseudoanthophilum]
MELSRPAGSQIVAASRPRSGQDVSAAPVRELERTIAGFQAILTDEDRKKLQQLKTTSHDSQSIITFTAELDLLDKNRRGKSVASRLASFLQTIEQFTPIVDTYIQSNPDIAALIWGSIKLTFLLLNGFGSLCTRFAEYQVIFNESTRLKTSVCQFHTAVVTCCQQIVLAVRRPLKNQILKAITQSFQSELRSYVEDIRAKAEEVQGDIQLVKAQCDREEQQLQTTERQDASNHRKRLMAWTSKATGEIEALQAQRRRNESEQKRRRFLEELSSFNFTSGFNSTRNKRHIGTAKWVFETPEFQKWIGIDGSPVLHVTGKIGSGKTVLSSSIVEKLSQVRPPQQFVSFFFVRFDDPLSLDADTILRSCVQQLISAINIDSLDRQIASELDKSLSEAKWSLFSLESLSKLYLSAAQAIEHWFMVVDGLDECNNDQQSRFLRFFQGLLSGNNTACNISILISSRETCTNAIRSTFPGSQRLTTGLKSTSADIGSYVDDIIIDKLSTGELVISDPNLLNEILETIASKEQGMFLWAFFVIEDICSRKTDPEIRQALQLIPADLPATFDRVLGRIVKRRNQDVAKKAFMWTNATLQPLTWLQLREALSIKPGQHTLRQEDLISGIERLPAWCENLIYVEETDNTVRFSHHSIQEYLLASNSGEHRALHIDPDQSDKLAGEVCITYVNLDNFQTTLAERKGEPLTPSAMKIDPSGIAEQTIQAAIQGGVGTRVGRIARRFVKTSNANKTSTEHEFSLGSPIPVASKVQGAADYTFLEYASKNWFKHTKYINKKETKIWRLLGRLIRRPALYSQGEPWHSAQWENEAMAGFPSYEDPRTKCFTIAIHFLADSIKHSYDPPSSEVPLFSSIVLAFFYAELSNYRTLACRSFQSLMRFYRDTGPFNRLICALIVHKNYEACRGDCLDLLPSGLDHCTLVEELRKAITRGILYFPGLAQYEAYSSCNCAHQPPHTLKHEMCNALQTGYRREDEPHIQAFCILVESFHGSGLLPTVQDLGQMCLINDKDMTESRTSHRMLLLDVLIQGFWISVSDMPQFPNVSRQRFKSRQNIKTIQLSDLIARFMDFMKPTFIDVAAESQSNGLPSQLSPTRYTICFLDLLEAGFDGKLVVDENDLQQYSRFNELIKLHEGSVAAIFNKLVTPTLWPTFMATYIVKTLFWGSILTSNKDLLESSFKEAVQRNNWDVAAALIRRQTISVEGETNDAPFTWLQKPLLYYAWVTTACSR